MARRIEFTGEVCECGEPTFARVVTLGLGVESRRGPSCWLEECAIHRSWQDAAAQRVEARNALVALSR